MDSSLNSASFAESVIAQPANDLYLNSVRNALILLTLGMAVMRFDPEWSKWSVWMMILGIFFLVIVVLHYYFLGRKSLFMNLTTFGVCVLIGILIWLTLEAYT